MRCVCGERLVRKSKIPEEGYVIVGRYVLLKAGSLSVKCKSCGATVDLMKSKPTVLRTTKKVS
jgi:hypothetical protein